MTKLTQRQMAQKYLSLLQLAAKGGHMRAAKLTPKRRSTIARKAAQARWAKARARKAQVND